METKPWYTSKTLWLNVATLLSLAPAIPEVVQIVPDGAVRYIAAAVALLNLAIRLFGTSGAPLTMRRDQ